MGVTFTARDVTEQQRLARALAESEERQRLLLETLPDTMIALYDSDLKCVLLQGSVLAQAGLDVNDFVGRPMQETLPAAQFEQLEPLVRQALIGEAGAVEYASALSGLTYALTVMPYRLADGGITGAFVVGRNIVDRLADEQKLRHLARIVEQSAEAITSKALDGTITEWNQGAQRLYGYSAQEAIGQPVSMLVPAERHGEEFELLARVLDGESVSQLETVRVRQDGVLIDVSITVSLIRDAVGEPVGASVITRDITARKLAERQLQHQTWLLAESQAVAHIGSWEWDLCGQRLAWSDELCRIAGQPIGSSPTVEEFMAMVHPDDRGAVSSGVEAAREGIASDSEYRILRPDGEVRYTAGRRCARVDESGAVTHLFGTIQDVTEQRFADHERQRAGGELATAQRIARVGSWSWDPETDTATWSEEMYRIFGRDPSLGPATSEALFSCVHPQDRERLAAGYAQAFGGGPQFELDYRITAGDGVERVLHGLGRADRDRPGAYVGTVQDVTELRATERALSAAEQRFRNAMQFAPIGMALVSPEGQWLQVNQAICELVGYEESELLTLTFQDITHPDDLGTDLAFVHALLAGEIPSYTMQKRYFHRSGTVVWVQLSVSLVRDEDGAPVHFISQIQDISAEKAAREALEESERRYQSIAANVPGMVYRFAMSPEGHFSIPFASAGARELYGVEPSVLTADVSITTQGVNSEDRTRLLESITASARTLTRWEWYGRRQSSDGKVKYLHATAQPTRESDGSTVWDGVLLDETAVRHAQYQEAETRQRLQLILQNLAGSAVVLYDRELRLQFCEGPLFADVDMSEMLGRPLPEFVSGEVMQRLGPGVQGALAGDVSTAVLDVDTDGKTLAVQFAPYRTAAGRIEGALVHWQDISAVRVAEEQRDKALEQFQVAFERAPIGMVVVGLDGRFERVNDALCEITGYASQDLLEMAPFAVVQPEDLDQVQQQFAQVGVLQDSMTLEHRVAHAAGHPVWVQARVTLIRDEHDQPMHVLAQIQDISERRSYEANLRHMADHDPLTGLINRRGLEAALEGHLAHCRRYGVTGALLVLDLDGFKYVNDTLGHAAGDKLIISTAHALTSRLRETDTIARLGGDEFAILLPTQTESEAQTVAQALVDAVRRSAASMSQAHPGRVTASIGVAMFTDATLTADEILVNADLAMYDAKEAGKDRAAFYGQDGHSVPRIKAQMSWMQRIERALEEERFALYAQPIVDVQTRRVVQHEVLVRMLDDHGDLIPPNTFLYIAERFGQIRALDRWIITQAIRTMANHQAHGHHLPLAVNISGVSTGDPDILDAISRELRVGKIAPEDLTLEITETAAVADIPRARHFADALTDIGCRIALDDFGAGFGSFYYLKHLPFDIVKIDGEFVRRATENAADRLVIKAVSEIAHGLGKMTVAEFVPNEATMRLLRRNGVDLAQGYYLGRPAPLDDLAAAQVTDPRRS